MYIDSHCHLDHLDLEPYGGSLDAALESARQAGVSGFLLIGIDSHRFDELLAIESAYPDVWLSIGKHPLDEKLEQPAPHLAMQAAHPAVVAVGETGLDYHYAPEQRQVQLDSFREHLDIAAQVNKPVIVHSRAAKQDTLDLIGEYQTRVRGVLHCFTEDLDMAMQAVELGYYISLSGIVTFRNADALREVAAAVPADRLLIETDSPWLAPVPHRGRKNEPKYLPDVARVVAEQREVTPRQLADLTRANFFDLFALAGAGELNP